MVTPTLFDIASITSFLPTRKTFDPTLITKTEPVFDFDLITYKHFVKDFHETGSEEVSYQEYISFLTYWISLFVFGSSSSQVTKNFINMATQLHEGRNIILSKLILGSLYEALGLAAFDFKSINDPE